MSKLEPYDKNLDYSYALGLFPAITLMQSRPEQALRLLTQPSGAGNDGVEKLAEMCENAGVRREDAERVLRRESKKDNCFAAVVFKKYECALDACKNHAVLCRISDMGNFGTALRSLLGFGIRDVAVIRPCVDIFDPRAVRASMGALFKMRVRAFDSFDEYRESAGERALYPFMLTGAIPLPDAARQKTEPFSLIFGNEATGLPDEFAEYGQSVKIPQTDEIDSLNLAVAVAIGAYAFTGGAPQ